jgi:hypothetical protein
MAKFGSSGGLSDRCDNKASVRKLAGALFFSRLHFEYPQISLQKVRWQTGQGSESIELSPKGQVLRLSGRCDNKANVDESVDDREVTTDNH